MSYPPRYEEYKNRFNITLPKRLPRKLKKFYSKQKKSDPETHFYYYTLFKSLFTI